MARFGMKSHAFGNRPSQGACLFAKGNCSAFLPPVETRSCPEITHIQQFRDGIAFGTTRRFKICRVTNGPGQRPAFTLTAGARLSSLWNEAGL